jgi:3-dehydroquinate synthase
VRLGDGRCFINEPYGEIIMTQTLMINLTPNYPIHIGNYLLESDLLFDFCNILNKKLVIITDSNLENTLGKMLQETLLARGLSVEMLVFPAGEAHKTRETKAQLEDQLLKKKYGRDTCIIALGGGVVTDLAGFVAATYCRGIPVIYVPTTLLAMVDASIGGKTGVNTPEGKNMIGCFYQPLSVFMDVHTLVSLPEKEWANGIVEMIKHSVITDEKLFYRLKNELPKILKRDSQFLIEMIYASCEIKKHFVEQDEKDLGKRKLLNFGHTIGHAIESIEQCHLSHGESIQCGFLSKEAFNDIEAILKSAGLPLTTKAFANKNLIYEKLAIDKKSLKNTAQFVLLDSIGAPHGKDDDYTIAIEADKLDAALDWALKKFQ